ncbi:MAG: TMEM165/GDT1 family protein [Thaumarchaeota archaeon]|nr:TMEM165/GDT1 family protein [Nitrososphaerota archaeon]
MALDLGLLLSEFATVVVTIFIAELTDKDALLLLALATRMKPWSAFAAGSMAFTITSAIIVTIGYFLIQIVPIFWIRLAGGVFMIFYALWDFSRSGIKEEKSEEARLLDQAKRRKSALSVFLGAVALLIFLDLAGDATEIVTIVFVARYSNAILVFLGAVTALVTASALETLLGARLGKFLSPTRLRYFSLVVFLIIGTIIILTTVFS